MKWLWNALQGGKKPSRRRSGGIPTLTRGTSARIIQLDKGRQQHGSLVLEKEDLRILEVQTKIDQVIQKQDQEQDSHSTTVGECRQRKNQLLLDIDIKLKEMCDDSVYHKIIQNMFVEEGMIFAPPGDGSEEAKIVKKIHSSELYDKSRALFQHQSSDDMMEIYGTSAKIKERMSEREARLLSVLVEKDTLVQQQRALNEKMLEIQAKMIERLQQGAKDHFQKQYDAIRNGNTGDDGDKGVSTRQDAGRGLADHRSYSARVLGADFGAKPTKQTLDLQDLTLDEEKATEEAGETEEPISEGSAHNEEHDDSHSSHSKPDEEKSATSPTASTRRSPTKARRAKTGGVAVRSTAASRASAAARRAAAASPKSKRSTKGTSSQKRSPIRRPRTSNRTTAVGESG